MCVCLSGFVVQVFVVALFYLHWTSLISKEINLKVKYKNFNVLYVCVFVRCLDAINPILSFFCPFPFLTQEQDNVAGVSEAAKPDQPHLAPHRRIRGFPL